MEKSPRSRTSKFRWLRLRSKLNAQGLARGLESAAALIYRHLLAAGLFVFIFGVTWSGVLTPIDDMLMDWRFSLLKRAPTQSLVVVEIDPDSLTKLQSWPWSRSIYATVVRNLQQADARAIGIDVDFSSLSDFEGDRAFRDSLRDRPGEVVLSVFVQPQSDTSVPNGLRQTAPHPFFMEHAAVASVNLPVERSGIARRGWYGSETMDGYLSSFAASLASFPPTRTGPFHIDFSIDPKRLVRLSIADVAAGTFDLRAVAGRNVLIGATAFELGDEYSAPVYGLLPGVILHALSYESLAQGRALFRVQPFFVLPIVAVLLIFLLPLGKGGWTRSARPYSGVLGHAAVSFCALAFPVALQAVAPVSVDVAPILVAQLVCIGLATLGELERRARDVIRHQLEVAHNQALITLVVRDSSDGIIITDEFRKIIVFNDRATELLNVEHGNCNGLSLTEVIPDFPVCPTSRVEGDANNPVPTEYHPIVSQHIVVSDAGELTLEVVGDWTLYGGRRNTPGGAAVKRQVFAYSLRDITARKRIERAEIEAKEAAIAANNAKSQLITTMSHELRTPLNAIVGFSSILQGKTLGSAVDEEHKTFVGYINDSGQRLLSVVNHIMQVAELEAGEITAATDEFDLGMLVEGCAAPSAAGAEATRRVIRTAIPHQLRLNGDEGLLRRALSHLLSNALKFTAEGDVIEIKAWASAAAGVRIEISDTGVGVDSVHLPKLTDAFYQADGSLSRTHEGVGLGLCLVKKYVELHGGVLTLESERNLFFKARIDLPPTCLSCRRDAA